MYWEHYLFIAVGAACILVPVLSPSPYVLQLEVLHNCDIIYVLDHSDLSYWQRNLSH